MHVYCEGKDVYDAMLNQVRKLGPRDPDLVSMRRFVSDERAEQQQQVLHHSTARRRRRQALFGVDALGSSRLQSMCAAVVRLSTAPYLQGQNSLVDCGPDLNQAKTLFCKKFEDKTKNEWSDRMAFEKVSGKYDMLQVMIAKSLVAVYSHTLAIECKQSM